MGNISFTMLHGTSRTTCRSVVTIAVWSWFAGSGKHTHFVSSSLACFAAASVASDANANPQPDMLVTSLAVLLFAL